jgi:hypothetical protein
VSLVLLVLLVLLVYTPGSPPREDQGKQEGTRNRYFSLSMLAVDIVHTSKSPVSILLDQLQL